MPPKRKKRQGTFLFNGTNRRVILILDHFKIVTPDNSKNDWDECDLPDLMGWIVVPEKKTEYWISIHEQDFPDLITGLEALKERRIIQVGKEEF